jgi:hypothetical protein
MAARMSIQREPSILWRLTGMMVLIIAAACGAALSGAATAVSAVLGFPETTIGAFAVVTLLVGFAAGLAAGLRDLAGLARRDEPSLPRRWIVASMAVLFVVGPFWNLCVVQIQEPISGSDSVRILFDNVMYGLVLSLALPLALGVPLVLTRVRRRHGGGHAALA